MLPQPSFSRFAQRFDIFIAPPRLPVFAAAYAARYAPLRRLPRVAAICV